MNSNMDIKQLPKATKNFFKKFLKHAKFVFIIVVLSLAGFLIFEINVLINQEPTDEQISAQSQTIKRPKIDQDTINKIEQLEDHNVAVQSLFKHARDNPFSD
jgi:hypothetical protein